MCLHVILLCQVFGHVMRNNSLEKLVRQKGKKQDGDKEGITCMLVEERNNPSAI